MTQVVPKVTPINIPQIQGRGSISPHNGKVVTTGGVITAIQPTTKNPGFFLQDRAGDNDLLTSDALFVSTLQLPDAKRLAFEPGQQVTVAGRVSEDSKVTTLLAVDSKSIKPNGRKLVASKLPEPTTLDLPASSAQSKLYLESREGMLSTIDNAMVIGASNKYNSFVVVDSKKHGPHRDFGPKNEGQRLAVSGALGIRTQMITGDEPGGIKGPLSFRWDNYELLQTKHFTDTKRGPYPPAMWGDVTGDDKITQVDLAAIKKQIGSPAAGPLDAADLNGNGKIERSDVTLATKRAKQETGAPSFKIATFNTLNFFDDKDAPPPIDDEVVSTNQLNAKLARMAGAIKNELRAPDVLALQEFETEGLLTALAERPELKPFNYKHAMMQTPGRRNINIGFMYKGDSVELTNVRQAQKIVEAGKGQRPSANGPQDEAPLFSRPPLIADVKIKNGDKTAELTVIANHLISKFSPQGLPTEPLRIEQAKFINGLVKDLRTKDPQREIVVVGDMNDSETSKSLRAMTGRGKTAPLVNVLVKNTPQGERYSYNYLGNSELIDHILTTPGLATQVERTGVRHFNADVSNNATWGTAAFGASDHDAPYAEFRFPETAAAQAATGAQALATKSTANKAGASAKKSAKA